MPTLRRLGVALVAACAVTAVGGTTAAVGAVRADVIGGSGTDLGVDEIGRSANVEHLANVPHAGPLTGGIGTDIAFSDGLAYVGNYNGFVIYDVSRPAAPVAISIVNCPGSQNDVTISGHLLYLSTDSSRSDDSCSSVAQPATVKESWEGIKIFDVSDPRNPRYIKSVETACGSHTNTLVPGTGKNSKKDYIYVSSYSPSASFPDCQPPHDAISIIEVDRRNPTAARVAAVPNLFPDGGNPGGAGRSATTGCHDITAYPSRRIAAGACMGDGVIMDISKPLAPKVIDRVTDTNFAFWHSATFNNTGTKVVFTDELGGGTAATCNTTVGPTRGASGIYDLSKRNKLTFRSYYKIDRHQGATENCVAHNGSLIPVKGRDVMVQSWYQGGVSFWEFTDSGHPRELGYFERGRLEPADVGGSWSAYYYRGTVFSSDIRKGFDVLKITDRNLRKAGRVWMDQLNPQSQPVYKTR